VTLGTTWKARKLGKRARRVLEPVAEELGVDYDNSYLTPPTTDAELVMNALRCGEQLIVDFASAEGWPVDDLGRGISKDQARKAAKCVEQALLRKEGRDALSVMAQGYGRALAAGWRAAANTDEYRDASDRLKTSAARSERLATLVASTWPARGYEAVLAEVARADAHRMFDVDNPNALVDLSDYAWRARAIADALAVAMSARFEEFKAAILGPVFELHVGYNLLTSGSWTFIARQWGNLLEPHPLSRSDVAQKRMAEAAG